MTTDFARARTNMVNAQLATNGIHNEALVEAYLGLPRETFVEDALRPYVYMDDDVSLPGGKRFVLEPLVEARMLQEAVSGPAGCALVLGASSLPSIVMLASFVTTVIVVEPDPDIATRGQARLTAQEVCNTVLIETDYRQGYARQAPYDVIFVPGAVTALPPVLADQLSIGGRMVCVLRETARAQGRIVLARKQPDGTLDATIIADAATPYLAGFEPSSEFVF